MCPVSTGGGAPGAAMGLRRGGKTHGGGARGARGRELRLEALDLAPHVVVPERRGAAHTKARARSARARRVPSARAQGRRGPPPPRDRAARARGGAGGRRPIHRPGDGAAVARGGRAGRAGRAARGAAWRRLRAGEVGGGRVHHSHAGPASQRALGRGGRLRRRGACGRAACKERAVEGGGRAPAERRGVLAQAGLAQRRAVALRYGREVPVRLRGARALVSVPPSARRGACSLNSSLIEPFLPCPHGARVP